MTLSNSNINIAIDPAITQKASAILSTMGIDVNTAVDMFFRQVIKEHKLPFQPSTHPEIGANQDFLDAIKRKGIPIYTMPRDEDGHVILDELPEHIRDWVVNG